MASPPCDETVSQFFSSWSVVAIASLSWVRACSVVVGGDAEDGVGCRRAERRKATDVDLERKRERQIGVVIASNGVFVVDGWDRFVQTRCFSFGSSLLFLKAISEIAAGGAPRVESSS